MAKVSIITINLNNINGLEKTIASVLTQTFKNIEFIIIDGGSADGSIEFIEKNVCQIAYWLSEPDKGIYHAMNKGIINATGDYCFFLNSGDYFADNEVLERIFDKNPSEDILFGNLYVTKNGKMVEKAYGKVKLTFSDVYAHTIKHQAAFVKRDLFFKFGQYNENRKIIADWEFFIKTIGLGNVSYKYINAFIAYFNNDGISNNCDNLVNIERINVIHENIPLLMHEDFEFLKAYKKYEHLYNNKFAFFFIRLLNKLFQMTH
jgi:glycosyltransferase involved in cell wall biosynthesis